jgi:hypothetical protein
MVGKISQRYTMIRRDRSWDLVSLTPKIISSSLPFDQSIFITLVNVFNRPNVIFVVREAVSNVRMIWIHRVAHHVPLLNCFFSSPSIVNQLLLL